MKLEDIMTEAEKYFSIDETNLGKESLATPKIYGNLLRIRTTESMVLKKLSYQLKDLVQTKRDYYLGRADPEVYKAKPFDTRIMKSEVMTYVENDDEVKDISLKMEIQEEKIEYLDNALKQISNRGFAIKNALDYQKLMSGGY